MSTLNAVADWVYALNPWQLCALTTATTSVLIGAGWVIGGFVYAALSGAGETNEGEAEGDK